MNRKKWSEVLDEARNASSDQDAHAAFVRACARAFAGTGFLPVSFNAWNPINSVVNHTVHLELTVHRLDDVLPLEDLFPRPAGVRDPRFHLRGQHPKRGSHAKKPASFRRYRRGCAF